MTNLININAKSVSLAAAATTSRVALPTPSHDTVLIDNALNGANGCYVKSGMADVVATSADMHIAAGEKATYSIDPSHTHIAAISPDGTNLRISVGAGW